MSTRSTITSIACGAAVVVAGSVLVRWRLKRRGADEALLDEDAAFTAYTPSGSQKAWVTGPGGWLTSRIMPVAEAGVYSTVAGLIDLQPEDDLIDIGCGPGGFVASKAQHVRRVVGLDTSPVMLRAAERRLAERIAAGSVELVLGNSVALPFGDATFSAATAIYAPAKATEVFRVLRPGGRFVLADPQPERKPSGEATVSYGRRRLSEADYRLMFSEAGFTDVTVRLDGRNGLVVFGRKGL